MDKRMIQVGIEDIVSVLSAHILPTELRNSFIFIIFSTFLPFYINTIRKFFQWFFKILRTRIKIKFCFWIFIILKILMKIVFEFGKMNNVNLKFDL
jgi:uncharacterized membrane protein